MKVILPRRLFSPDMSCITSLLAMDLTELSEDFTQQADKVSNYPLFDSFRQAKQYLNSISLHEQGDVISNIFYVIEIDEAYLSNMSHGKHLSGFSIKLPEVNSPEASLTIHSCVVNAIQISDLSYAIKVSAFNIDHSGKFKLLDVVDEPQNQMPVNATRHGRSRSYQTLESKMQSTVDAYSLAIPAAALKSTTLTSGTKQIDIVGEFMQACKFYFTGCLTKDILKGHDDYENLYPNIVQMADKLHKKELYRIAQYHKYINEKNLFWLQKASAKGHIKAKLDLIELYDIMDKHGDKNAADKAHELHKEILQKATKKSKLKQKQLIKNHKQPIDSVPLQADVNTQQTQATGSLLQATTSFDNQTMIVHDTLFMTRERSLHGVNVNQQEISQKAQALANKLVCPLLINKVNTGQPIAVAEFIALTQYAKLKINNYYQKNSGYIQSVISPLYKDVVLDKKRLDLASRLIEELNKLIQQVENSNETEISIEPLLLLIDNTMVQTQSYSLEHKKDASESRRSALYNALLEVGVNIIASRRNVSEASSAVQTQRLEM